MDPALKTGASRAEREIMHGKWLAKQQTEEVWGWDTPAGELRAQRRAQLIIDGAQLAPGKRALEIGCGTGLFTKMFAATGALIIAVDISGELLEKARERNLPPDRVKFLEKRFEDCDLEGPFDAVIGSSVLHHLEVDTALRQILGLLKPRGYLSFAEPNMLNPQVYLERRFQYLPMFSYTSPDETAFVRWKFSSQLRQVGFVNVSITPFDWLHPAIPKPLIRTALGLGKLIEHLPLAREFAGSLYARAQRPEMSG
jgi:2-polyprenyl-3-methyl-5-hydroxy-6-metoxy-1,4-benzoquinol methylase